MYLHASTCVRTLTGKTEDFSVNVGLHQGSSLSPYLFALVMDELTHSIQDDAPWCMLFADDVVLIDTSREGVERKLKVWTDTLEAQGLKISRAKTEYIKCNFSGATRREDPFIHLKNHELPQREHFKYLGSMMDADGDIDEDVKHRIGVGWLKWRAASGVLCDKQIPMKLKGKFYRTAILPALLYGTECWATKQSHIDKMRVAEMRMLRWMCGKTLRDRIPNNTIRAQLKVTPIEEKMREHRLRWFGHVHRRPPDAVVKRYTMQFCHCIKRGRGRPKRTWMETIRKDMEILELSMDMVYDKRQWKERIRNPDLNSLRSGGR